MVVKDNDDNIDYLFNKATAIILKKHREKANMSLEEVVQRMNSSITRQSLFKYENNLSLPNICPNLTNPGLHEFCRTCKYV